MSAKTTNKRIAQRIYDSLKGQIAEGKFKLKSRPKITFEEMVNEFLEKHSKVEKASYERDWFIGENLKKYFKNTPIEDIAPYDIKAWRQWRAEQKTRRGTRISKASLNRELTFLKTMFNPAVEWDWLDENPTRKVKLLKGEKKRTRFLTSEEVTRLIECSTDYLKPIIITAVSTGMRRGEILNLKWKDVDLNHIFIRVVKSKNNESRDIPINGFLFEALKGLEKSKKFGNYVFCNDNGHQKKSIKEAFKNACLRAGLKDLWFHDLRHTASLFASSGCDIIILKNLLGHKTLAMTQRYAHLIPDKHEKTRKIRLDFWRRSGATVYARVGVTGKGDFSEALINQ
jgi:integrase